MKFVATLFIAAIVASAVIFAKKAPAEPSKVIIAKANELKRKINRAIKAGKGSAEEVAKQLGEKRGQTIVKLDELKAQLKAKAKEVLISTTNHAKLQVAKKLKAQIEKAIKALEATKAKLAKVR